MQTIPVAEEIKMKEKNDIFNEQKPSEFVNDKLIL